MKKSGNSKVNNVVGKWYSTYAGKTFVLNLKKDKTFEYGYEEHSSNICGGLMLSFTAIGKK